jgi:hypothetical protein
MKRLLLSQRGIFLCVSTLAMSEMACVANRSKVNSRNSAALIEKQPTAAGLVDNASAAALTAPLPTDIISWTKLSLRYNAATGATG